MANTSVKVELKPIVRIRVRCAEAHTDPWLRRLYVVWAAIPPGESETTPGELGPETGEDRNPGIPALYAVAQSDEKGNLSPVMNGLDPATDATVPLFPDVDYQFYFVRHPAAQFAHDIASALNADPEGAKKRYGEARKLRAILTQTGVDKKKKPILEGVISLQEDPAWFVQNGSLHYGGWALFRNMPGTGSNKVDTDIQCRPLFDHVRRLQFQLGRLRYPIGNQWHPYSPEPWTRDATRKKQKAKLPGLLYPNEGVFEVCTWNCVLRFQRDVRLGLAMKLDPTVARTATLAPETFDPVPAAENRELEMKESSAFVTSIEASPGDAFALIADEVDTIVERQTANAIYQWLEKDFRKPGKILVNRGSWDSWMQEDAASSVDELDKTLKRLGVSYGLRFNNGFRDTRMSVEKAGPGQIINSIHKSGFAFDMAMSAYVGPLKAAPLYFEKDPAPGSGVQWIVFAEAQEAAIPEGPHEGYVEYRDSITPWKYDSDSPAGGAAEPALTKPGVKFLNFTNVCDQYSLRNIGAHKKGWQGKDPVSYTLDSDTAFSTFLGALVQEIALAANAPSAVGKVNGTSFTFSTFGDAAKYLNAWKSATRSLGPTPAVIIEPSTKEGESVIRALRGSAFAGRKISVSVDGVWFGGEGGSGFPTADTKPVPTQSTGTITLSAEAEFPPLLSFTATPVTSPAGIGAGAVVELPGLGHPSHMEWWHFQYEPGYKGKYWMEILELIGWTKEGLLSKAGNMPIFGLYGMGYSPTDIDGKAG